MRVVLGFLLLAAGAIALIPLPEAGLPLLLAGLRLVGERYAWARRANAWVDARAARARRWFERRPRPVQAAVVVLPLALIAGLVVLLL